MLAAAVLNTAVRIISDQRMRRPAGPRAASAAEQRCEPQIVVSGSQASALESTAGEVITPSGLSVNGEPP